MKTTILFPSFFLILTILIWMSSHFAAGFVQISMVGSDPTFSLQVQRGSLVIGFNDHPNIFSGPAFKISRYDEAPTIAKTLKGRLNYMVGEANPFASKFKKIIERPRSLCFPFWFIEFLLIVLLWIVVQNEIRARGSQNLSNI